MKDLFNGVFSSAAGALEDITLGCVPGYIVVHNITAGTKFELIYDGTNTKQLSTVAATGTITHGGTNLVLGDDGFSVAAAALTTGDVVVYSAIRLK